VNGGRLLVFVLGRQKISREAIDSPSAGPEIRPLPLETLFLTPMY
jgi:hypothetical protein